MRLAGKEKMGFYPTPEKVVEKIKSFFKFKEKNNVLDTCCGEGVALEIFKKKNNIKTYGVELSHIRYKIAKEKVDVCLNCDSLNDLIADRNSFDILFLNPPYDDEKDDLGQSTRLEILFLKRHFSYIKENGYLVYIIPIKHFPKAYYVLSRHFTDYHFFKFPDDEMRFEQGVIIAKRTKMKDIAKSFQASKKLKKIDLTDLPDIMDAELKLELPEPNKKEPEMISLNPVPEEIAEHISKSNIHQHITKELTPVENKTISPLKMPKIGHLALLLASGYLNGLIEKDGKRYLIKGQAVRETIEVETQYDEKTVTQKELETVKIKINLLDIDNKEIIELQ